MVEQDLQLRVQDMWDRFRTNMHAVISAKSSDGGSPGSNGDGIAHLRSETAKAGALVAYVTELFSGSGELLDTESLLSSCLNMGANLEGFTSTVLSLMFLVDAQYCMMNGKTDTVLRILDAFEKEPGEKTTFQSTSLKMPSIAERMESLEPVTRLDPGVKDKLDLKDPPVSKKKNATGSKRKTKSEKKSR